MLELPGQASAGADQPVVAGTCCQTEQTEADQPAVAGAEEECPAAVVWAAVWARHC